MGESVTPWDGELPARMSRHEIAVPEYVRIEDERGVWLGIRCRRTGVVIRGSLEIPSAAEAASRAAEDSRLRVAEESRRARAIEDEMIALDKDQRAAERLGLTARAAEYAAQISVLRGKLDALNDKAKESRS